LSAAEADKLHTAVIGIGSNIEPQTNLVQAVESLAGVTQIVATSKAYRTSPVGGDGPDYLNAAVKVETRFSINQLRSAVLRRIETQLGRRRSSDPNLPRTIDLDILIFDGILLDKDLWTLAHLCVPVSDLLPIFDQVDQNLLLARRAKELSAATKIFPIPLELHR
jgi:2-amino-4-hydroxy-6-hydroxymethyldihydropteridine diphosphokinase